MRTLKFLLLPLVVLLLLGFVFVYAGVFNVAADNPHWSITHRLIEAVREHSIRDAARSVGAPPALDNPQLIAMGAQEYDEMCTGCHLAPGLEETELRTGLYPKPPNLSGPGWHRKPAETFWVIKHGLKMTGMPAWGLTHDDHRLWSMVAFLQKLPDLSPATYQKLIEENGEGHHHDSQGSASEVGK